MTSWPQPVKTLTLPATTTAVRVGNPLSYPPIFSETSVDWMWIYNLWNKRLVRQPQGCNSSFSVPVEEGDLGQRYGMNYPGYYLGGFINWLHPCYPTVLFSNIHGSLSSYLNILPFRWCQRTINICFKYHTREMCCAINWNLLYHRGWAGNVGNNNE